MYCIRVMKMLNKRSLNYKEPRLWRRGSILFVFLSRLQVGQLFHLRHQATSKPSLCCSSILFSFFYWDDVRGWVFSMLIGYGIDNSKIQEDSTCNDFSANITIDASWYLTVILCYAIIFQSIVWSTHTISCGNISYPRTALVRQIAITRWTITKWLRL